MKKIVIISHDPLTKKINTNFMIDQYKDRSIDIEYWCIRDIIYNSFQYKFEGEIVPKYFREIKTIKELEFQLNLIEDSNKTVFIIEIPYTIKSMKIYKILNKFNLKLFTYEMYTATNIEDKKCNLLDKLKKYNRKFFVNVICKFKNEYIKHKLRKYNIYKNQVRFSCAYSGLNNNIIPINNFDYEEYKENNNPNEIKYKYCVFIDQYLPYHPDNNRNRLNSINANLYYSKLEQFFKQVEDIYGIKVIIAEHPKANYEDKKHFINFKRVQGDTCTLVKYAEFVLLHDSLSISYPILYNKPIIHIYTDEFKNIDNTMNRIKKLSNILGSKIYNIDRNDIEKLNYKNIDINYKKYDFYKYKYITSKQSENKKNIDIVINEFNKRVYN